MAAFADVEDFASTFEREFSLIACLSTCSGSSRDWCIDSGASTNMIGVREVFFEITKRDIDVEVELGDDMVVRAIGRGTIAFQRESRPPLRFQDVCYVSASGEEPHFSIDYRGQGIRGSLQRWLCVHSSQGCQLRFSEGDWH